MYLLLVNLHDREFARMGFIFVCTWSSSPDLCRKQCETKGWHGQTLTTSPEEGHRGSHSWTGRGKYTWRLESTLLKLHRPQPHCSSQVLLSINLMIHVITLLDPFQVTAYHSTLPSFLTIKNSPTSFRPQRHQGPRPTSSFLPAPWSEMEDGRSRLGWR